MRHLIVVDNPRKWTLEIPGVDIIAARTYLTDAEYSSVRNVKVYNLCRSYRYQSSGYYVSLLAAARGHKPFPNILAMQDIKSQTIIRIVSDELDSLIQSSLKPIHSDKFTLSIYFGKNLAKRYDKLSQRLFKHFQAPLLRAEFIRKGGVWFLRSLQPVASSGVPEEHRPFVSQMAQEFFRRRNSSHSRKETRYDLAMLVNPQEEMPPSDERALRRFVKAAESLGLGTELITREDFSRLSEFDGLFIRETTNVNHHTYRMARRAAAEGLVVIDDPESILKCSNKVYLAELLRKNGIPAPETVILNRDNVESIVENLGFPCILKQPDSAFSQGVIKVDGMDQYRSSIAALLEKSDLVIAQKFIPTSFDWRIGVLNDQPLFACRYHMARKHWQIYERTHDGRTHAGNADTISVEDVPPRVLKHALRAAKLIGNGLYGVDLKEINGRVYVIEINDNPNIDSGCEDALQKDALYLTVMQEILRRIECKKDKSS